MQFPIDWTDDRAIRSAFTYATRTGIGRTFGNMPIGWYQMHQCEALDELERRARQALQGLVPAPLPIRVRLKNGVFQANVGRRAGWFDCGRPRDIFDVADRKGRG